MLTSSAHPEAGFDSFAGTTFLVGSLEAFLVSAASIAIHQKNLGATAELRYLNYREAAIWIFAASGVGGWVGYLWSIAAWKIHTTANMKVVWNGIFSGITLVLPPVTYFIHAARKVAGYQRARADTSGDVEIP